MKKQRHTSAWDKVNDRRGRWEENEASKGTNDMEEGN